MTAAGDLAALRLTAKVDGSQGAKPFDLATRLQADVAGETKEVALQSLAGSFAKQPIKLERTATLRMASASYGLKDLDLSFGRARLRADATLGGGRASAKASLDPTPLAMFQPFGAPELGGTVALDLDVSGSSAAPKIDLVVDAKGVKARGKDQQTVPPANLALRAGIAGGQLDASAELAGVMDDPLRLQAALPLRIGLEPFAFELPRDRPIQGSLTGRTDLGRIAQILVLDGQRLQGLLTIDARFAGTLDRPLADGSIAIANGLVEDSISGVLLRDLTLRIVGDQSRINLATLSARDRRDGTLNGSGSLDLGDTSLTRLEDRPGARQSAGLQRRVRQGLAQRQGRCQRPAAEPRRLKPAQGRARGYQATEPASRQAANPAGERQRRATCTAAAGPKRSAAPDRPRHQG